MPATSGLSLVLRVLVNSYLSDTLISTSILADKPKYVGGDQEITEQTRSYELDKNPNAGKTSTKRTGLGVWGTNDCKNNLN